LHVVTAGWLASTHARAGGRPAAAAAAAAAVVVVVVVVGVMEK